MLESNDVMNAQMPDYLRTIIAVTATFMYLTRAIAMWRAVKGEQKKWFGAFFILTLLPVNTVGIVELIYLFRFAKTRLTINEVKSWLSMNTPPGKKKQIRS